MMRNFDKSRLFVYGTLLSPYYFQVIAGRDLPRRPAHLHGFRKVSSPRAFPYIVPDEDGVVYGVLIEGIDPETMKILDRYEDEGNLYIRCEVTVHVYEGEVKAFTYIGTPAVISEHLEEGEDVAARVEEHITSELEELIKAEITDMKDARMVELERRARRELLGGMIEELLREHFRDPSRPKFLAKYQIERSKLPSLSWMEEEPEALDYADSYIRLIVKQTIFNEIEEKVRREFKGITKVEDPFYEHTISNLVTLIFINGRSEDIRRLEGSLGVSGYRPEFEYIDYVVAAICIADEIYDRQSIIDTLYWINENRQPGATPLGAEMEVSTLGHRTIGAGPGEDPVYDGFWYFHDFDLERRFWKVGGYIDDHRYITGERVRKRGFLEFAFGRYKIAGDLSKPTTQDPWVLSELVNQMVKFIDIRPHSLHISLEIDRNRPITRLKEPDFLLCLLLMGGDLGFDDKGVLREKRIFQGEITNPYTGMDFSRFNEHKQFESDPQPKRVVEFTFPRLFQERSYEELIMALKGFQWASNPSPLELGGDSPYAEYHREIAVMLSKWSRSPEPVSEDIVRKFLHEVEIGLFREKHDRGGHTDSYIVSCMGRIEARLRERNEFVREHSKGRSGRASP